MHPGLEFVFGRADQAHPAYFGPGDAAGEHGLTLRHFRDAGFLGPGPVPHPTPGCPFCREGVPYRLCGRLVCNSCGSGVPEEHLYLWPLDLRAFLAWFAARQHLEGAVVRIDDGLWQLGSLVLPAPPRTCFFLRGGTSSDIGLRRINACQAPVVLRGALEQPRLPGFAGKTLSLLELLRYDGTLSVLPLPAFLRRGGSVRFTEAGALLAGDEPLGWVPPGTREYWLVDCLYRRRGRVVPFDEIRRHVRAHCPGSRDATDAATFCQKLRYRIKKAHGVFAVERVIVSGKRSGGYLMPATAFLETA
jgi:hypothetical protein